jgi:hypothetical protein
MSAIPNLPAVIVNRSGDRFVETVFTPSATVSVASPKLIVWRKNSRASEMTGAGSPMRNASPLGKPAMPWAALTPLPPLSSGFT